MITQRSECDTYAEWQNYKGDRTNKDIDCLVPAMAQKVCLKVIEDIINFRLNHD